MSISRRDLLAVAAAAGIVSVMPVAHARPVRKLIPMSFGAFANEAPNNSTEYYATATSAGSYPDVYMWYRNFNQPFDSSQLAACDTLGVVPMLTWEPWDWVGPTNATYQLADINSGPFDSYIASYARGLKSWGRTIYLRWGHEMNGNWYPWCASTNGNSSEQYVAAWRRIHGIFTSIGTPNVKWCWSPNVEYPGSTPLASLYPGNSYVDFVGVDGYNWGTSQPGKVWQTPGQVFDSTLNAVRSIAPTKKTWIFETASTESGGNKAEWITQFFEYLVARNDISGFVWVNINKETDWRINSSLSAEQAFRNGIRKINI